MPTGIRVGMDLISLIRTQTDESFKGYEVNADVDFYRYYLTAELGHWERYVKDTENDYSNNGDYWRVGADVNFLKNDPDKNMFFFGLRYGRSKFSENLSITTEDVVWGRSTSSYANTDLTGQWGELVTGLRVKMWKFFWMGYTARYKFGLSTTAPQGFEVYDVPGFGRTFKNTTWGFNYQIFIRIPVRKTNKSKASEVLMDEVK
jgi:hypothetical protein